jgi:hypothetical protein
MQTQQHVTPVAMKLKQRMPAIHWHHDAHLKVPVIQPGDVLVGAAQV